MTNLRVWVEDESRSIGTVALPDPFFKKVKSSPLIFIEVPIQERIRRILAEYGMFDAALLTDAVTRLRQQLGAAKVEQIIGHINQGNFEPAVSELLKYYDQNYIKAFRKFNTRKVDYLIIDDDDMIAHARQMILLSQKNNHGTDLS